MEVLHAALRRADGIDVAALSTVLARPEGTVIDAQVAERPPLRDFPGYCSR